MSNINPDSNKDGILTTPSPNLSIKEVQKLANELFGLTGKLKRLNSERDLNYRIDTETGDQYVIKIDILFFP